MRAAGRWRAGVGGGAAGAHVCSGRASGWEVQSSSWGDLDRDQPSPNPTPALAINPVVLDPGVSRFIRPFLQPEEPVLCLVLRGHESLGTGSRAGIVPSHHAFFFPFLWGPPHLVPPTGSLGFLHCSPSLSVWLWRTSTGEESILIRLFLLPNDNGLIPFTSYLKRLDHMCLPMNIMFTEEYLNFYHNLPWGVVPRAEDGGGPGRGPTFSLDPSVFLHS